MRNSPSFLRSVEGHRPDQPAGSGTSVRRDTPLPAPGLADQALDAALADREPFGQLQGGRPSPVAVHHRLYALGPQTAGHRSRWPACPEVSAQLRLVLLSPGLEPLASLSKIIQYGSIVQVACY